MHAQHPGRMALVLDLMEPMRPVVDAVVLGFVQRQPLAPADCTLREDGVCRLNPQLARTMARKVGEMVDGEACVIELIARIDKPSTTPMRPQ